MNAPQTRVDRVALASVAIAIAIDTATRDLAPLAVTLTDDDRKVMPRARTAFPEAARVFADLMVTRPDIAAITGYDADAVREDLDNAAAVANAIPRLQILLHMLQDSHLQWLAEAQEPTLAAYGVAKERAKRDGSLTVASESSVTPWFVPTAISQLELSARVFEATTHMGDARVHWHQETRQPVRQVLIEQQSQPVALINRRSRSAAKARQARTSSTVRSGKSSTICSAVIPEAK